MTEPIENPYLSQGEQDTSNWGVLDPETSSRFQDVTLHVSERVESWAIDTARADQDLAQNPAWQDEPELQRFQELEARLQAVKDLHARQDSHESIMGYNPPSCATCGQLDDYLTDSQDWPCPTWLAANGGPE